MLLEKALIHSLAKSIFNKGSTFNQRQRVRGHAGSHAPTPNLLLGLYGACSHGLNMFINICWSRCLYCVPPLLADMVISAFCQYRIVTQLTYASSQEPSGAKTEYLDFGDYLSITTWNEMEFNINLSLYSCIYFLFLPTLGFFKLSFFAGSCGFNHRY